MRHRNLLNIALMGQAWLFCTASAAAKSPWCDAGCTGNSCGAECWAALLPGCGACAAPAKGCDCAYGANCPKTGTGDCHICAIATTGPCNRHAKKCDCLGSKCPNSCTLAISYRGGIPQSGKKHKHWWPRACHMACQESSASPKKPGCSVSACKCQCDAPTSRCTCGAGKPCAGQTRQGRVWCDCGETGCKVTCDGNLSGHWCGLCNGYSPDNHLSGYFACDGASVPTCCDGCWHHGDHRDKAYGCATGPTGDEGQSLTCHEHCGSKSVGLCLTEFMCMCPPDTTYCNRNCQRCDSLRVKGGVKSCQEAGAAPFIECGNWIE